MNQAERPTIEALSQVIERLRAPTKDAAARMLEVEPMITAANTAWSKLAATGAAPSSQLIGMTRSLKVELDLIKTRIEMRGRILARVRRAILETQGSVYTRGAARMPLPVGSLRGQSF